MSDITRVISLVKDYSAEELTAALAIRDALVPSPSPPSVPSYAPKPVRPVRARKPAARRAMAAPSTSPPQLVPTTASELRSKPARAARRSARIRVTPATPIVAAAPGLEKNVLDVLEKHGSLRAEHVRQYIGGEAKEIKATLAALKRRGAITASGNKRATAYQVANGTTASA